MKKLLAVLLLATLLIGCSGKEPPVSSETKPTAGITIPAEPTETTLPTETVSAAIPGYGNNNIYANSSYAVTQASPDDETMRAVIAVNADTDAVFDNRQLQIAFWTEYQNFLSSYGEYIAYMGLDTNLALDAQFYTEEQTWEQYFMEHALTGLERNYALSQYAYANGYVMDEEDLAVIEGITDPNGDFAQEYTSLGFADADSYIKSYFGDGTDAAAYQEYNLMYFAAADCYYEKFEALQAELTEDAVIAYYDENADSFAQQGVLKCNNINVRHILIQPEGEEASWTEESWAAAEAAAQAIYDEWKTNATEENFAALATEHTQDPGSQETGGLYDEVAPGTMVTEFNDWCFDESRQSGDHGIVKTSYGYHIMYFVGEGETRAWYDSAAEELLYGQLEAFLEECITAYPLSYDYTLMRVYDLVSATAEEPVG